ncbi:glycosyltransferase family 1 protein [Cellulomonas cellasea]|uniref:Glycosyltransferase involved in cell wall biosynthesis n=1 Tax=Cellulomonas cellasea TaxID=43670 RepID=A0A7W4UEU9_9CELL|nr:glycosyltransferase family 1 protein [Cellulomonas cellasea]MBB2922902.1 glycosyltransferase involved in cell wall biosynthesis [Cellulomonas cellasea]
MTAAPRSERLRVLIDATAIPPDLGGVGRYVAELCPALARAGVDVVVVAQARDVEALGRADGVEVLAAPGRIASRAARLAWEQVGLPGVVRSVGADVLHSPHYTMPARVDAARVVTLHDATFFSAPEVHSRVKQAFFTTATRLAVARADALVVPSHATQEQVLAHVRGDARRFVVAHHGVDTARFHPVPEAERARVARSLGLEGRPYVAFLGTLEPRKNVPALVRAWVGAVEGTDPAPALVLAGGPGWDREVDPAVAAVPAGLRLVRPGYLPYEDLAGYLAGAALVAYPSLGEGFGLPVLEAMACGAAVLTSRELSLPEVGGDAVAYAGTDEASLRVALRSLLADPDRRADLARRAVERAALFTWDAAAAAHVTAFEAAVRRRRER